MHVRCSSSQVIPHKFQPLAIIFLGFVAAVTVVAHYGGPLSITILQNTKAMKKTWVGMMDAMETT